MCFPLQFAKMRMFYAQRRLIILLFILYQAYFGMAVNVEGSKNGMFSQIQPLTQESTNAELRHKVILPDLNLSPPPSYENEYVQGKEGNPGKSVKQVDQTKNKKKRRYPFMNKEERKILWREEKRKTRAKLSEDVRLARSRRDAEVKKKRFANAVSWMIT